MPRNLSESQLVQMGSKALSNVAGQFSKLSQSLNPKIRTGKRIENDGEAPTTEEATAEQVPEQKAQDSDEAVDQEKTSYSSGSDENDCNIYDPDDSDLVQQNPIYNENTFLPSVGIVMAPNEAPTTVGKLENKDNNSKLTENVSVLSISSVTDNVKMPSSMIEKQQGDSVRSASPTPEIRVQEIDELSNLAKSSGLKFCHSAAEMRQDSSPDESRYARLFPTILLF